MITTEEIIVANIKCSGCATTIRKELLKLDSVSAAEVLVEEATINVTYDAPQRDRIIHRLLELGYPEATEENGLLLQAKSFASCMVGRINNL